MNRTPEEWKEAWDTNTLYTTDDCATANRLCHMVEDIREQAARIKELEEALELTTGILKLVAPTDNSSRDAVVRNEDILAKARGEVTP